MGVVVSISEWFGGKNEPWRKLARQQRVECVDEDTGEIIDIKPSQDDPTDIDGLLVQFGYRDAGGNGSTRVVLCHQCWSEGNYLYIRGMCTTREALRTFRVDRMCEVLEIRSKRLIEKPLDYFLAFAEDVEPETAGLIITQAGVRWQPRSRAQIEAEAFARHQNHLARRACISGLRVIAYIALADGLRSDEERNVEISFIESRLAMCGFDYDRDRTEVMLDVAAGLAVPPGSLTRALNEVAKDKDYFGLALSSAKTLANVDGEIHQAEAMVIDRLTRAGKANGWL